MKRIVLLAALLVIAANSAGCNSCRSRSSCGGGWFSRNNSCDTCPPGGVQTMYGPSGGGAVYGAPAGPEYLPGPVSTYPTG